ncbi:MAG: alpha/beta hydrolase [Pirellulales bacterium]|nr:alpha/beta hydrolase [Pirellulales bacterium]
MFDERRVTVRGLELNVANRTGGRAPAIVFVHGVLRRWTTFLPLFPALASRWQLVAIDQRGHGHSARTADGDYFVADYVLDLVELLERHAPAPVVIYGHSLGAMVAAGAAAARPDLVRAIVLEDPPFETMGARIGESSLLGYFASLRTLLPWRQSVADLARALAELVLSDPVSGRTWRLGEVRDFVQLRYQASCLAAVDPAVLDPIVAGRWLSGYDWQQVLRGVKSPALVLQADEAVGGMLIDADTAQTSRLLADGTIIRFGGAGHSLHTARTMDVTNHLLTFLAVLD